MLSIRRRFGAALVIGCGLVALGAQPVHADDAAVAAGVCTVVGTMADKFSPSVGVAPSGVTVSLSGSASCVGDPVMNTMTVFLTTNALLSCAAGEGTLAGEILFGAGFPPITVTTGLYIGGPGSETFELTGGGLTVAGALAWSPTSTATCPLSGTSSTSLSGTIVYAFE